jgi:hypothetical protein
VAPRHGPAPALATHYFKRAEALGQPSADLATPRAPALPRSSVDGRGVETSEADTATARLRHAHHLGRNRVAAHAASLRLGHMGKGLSRLPPAEAAALVRGPACGLRFVRVCLHLVVILVAPWRCLCNVPLFVLPGLTPPGTFFF